MKRMFFAVTVCTLAIAATAATKANSRVFEAGYTQSFDNKCTVISNIDCPGGTIDCKDGAGNQLFRFDDANPCSTKLLKP